MSEERKGFTRLHLFACLLLALVVGCALGAVATLCGRGSLAHFALVFPILFVAPPLFLFSFLFGGAAFVRRKKSGPALAWMSALSGCAAIVLVFVGLSVFPGAVLNRWDLREARFFCESLIPALESHRSRTGNYPVRLTDLGITDEDLPPILDDGALTYFADDDYYQFEFLDPGGMMTGYVYDSDSHDWHKWD